MAHRGNRVACPENTLAAFRRALEDGADLLETDLYLSADGAFVCIHDPTLDRTTDGRGPVEARTLAGLKAVSASCGRPEFAAERIPTLAEVFQACADVPDLWWVVEVKLDPTDPREVATRHTLLDGVLGEINAAGLRERTFVHSFDWAVLELSHRLDPQVPRSALAEVGDTWRPGSPWTGRVRWEDHNGDLASAAAELGVAVLSPDAPGCDAGLVAGAHDRGIAVLPWTVNDLAEVDRLAAAGVRWIVTDDPDLVLARLAERPGRARHAH